MPIRSDQPRNDQMPSSVFAAGRWIMSPRLFGLLMLLWASSVVGAGYSLNQKEPQVMAEASVADSIPASTAAAPEEAAARAGPPIRVILPSPYEIRTN
jgi:hypothetical protein